MEKQGLRKVEEELREKMEGCEEYVTDLSLETGAADELAWTEGRAHTYREVLEKIEDLVARDEIVRKEIRARISHANKLELSTEDRIEQEHYIAVVATYRAVERLLDGANHRYDTILKEALPK
jgi:hypothetical protein